MASSLVITYLQQQLTALNSSLYEKEDPNR